jgi:hypothetical protein
MDGNGELIGLIAKFLLQQGLRHEADYTCALRLPDYQSTSRRYRL